MSLYWLANLFRLRKVVNINDLNILEKSPASISKYIYQLCNEYTMREMSCITTYWHQLSLVYIRYKGRRICLLALKVYEIYYSQRKSTGQGLHESARRWIPSTGSMFWKRAILRNPYCTRKKFWRVFIITTWQILTDSRTNASEVRLATKYGRVTAREEHVSAFLALLLVRDVARRKFSEVIKVCPT